MHGAMSGTSIVSWYCTLCWTPHDPHHAKRPMVCRRGQPSLLVRGSSCCLSICNSSAAVVCVLPAVRFELHPSPACLPSCSSGMPACLLAYLSIPPACLVDAVSLYVLCRPLLRNLCGCCMPGVPSKSHLIFIWLCSSEDDRAFLLACLPHCLPVRLPLYLCRFCRTFRCWHVPPAGYGCMRCCRAAGPTSGKAASQSGRHQHCRAQGLQQ